MAASKQRVCVDVRGARTLIYALIYQGPPPLVSASLWTTVTVHPSSVKHLLCRQSLMAFVKHSGNTIDDKGFIQKNPHTVGWQRIWEIPALVCKEKRKLVTSCNPPPIESPPKPSQVRTVSSPAHSSGLSLPLCDCTWGHGDCEWSRLAKRSDSAHAEPRPRSRRRLCSLSKFQMLFAAAVRFCQRLLGKSCSVGDALWCGCCLISF